MPQIGRRRGCILVFTQKTAKPSEDLKAFQSKEKQKVKGKAPDPPEPHLLLLWPHPFHLDAKSSSIRHQRSVVESPS